MSDYISREAASADSDRNKIKTPFARIVVEGTPGKPYYNIWYFDPADGECHIWFGSYCLDNVFNWLAEEFEITEPHTDVAPVVHGRWELLRKGDWASVFVCSVCGRRERITESESYNSQLKMPREYPYCHCGARMDGDDDAKAD